MSRSLHQNHGVYGWLVSVLLMASCAACDRPEAERPAPEPERAQLAEAQALYDEYCGLCHGDQGQGYAADNANALANQNFLAVASDRFLRDAISQGRPGTAMSAWSRLRGGPLRGGDIHKLVRLIRSWQTEESVDVHDATVSGELNRALPLYAEHCASCHGDDGSGASALSLNNPRFLATASDGFLRYSIAHGRPGTPMPAFQGDLSDQAIDDLVVLVRSWQRAVGRETPVGEVELDYSNLVVNPEGGTPSFNLREERFVSSIQVRDALAAGQRIILLDARPTSDWVVERIVGSVPVPFYIMEQLIGALPRDGTHVVAYCGCPHAASGRVVDRLRREGFENTSVLDEGVRHWIREGYPTARGNPNEGGSTAAQGASSTSMSGAPLADEVPSSGAPERE